MISKKLISLILAGAVAVSLAAGCSKDKDEDKKPEEPETPTAVQLTAPQITLTGNEISWQAVEHATGYDVYEGETAVSQAQTALKYTINKTEAGSYTYTVKAVSTDTKYTASAASNSVTYTVQESGGGDDKNTDTSVKLTGKVYLVGDSTVCSYKGKDADRYIPRDGYGTQLYNYLNCDENQVTDLAVSGESSYSFKSEPEYNTLKNSLTSGDYLFIGFGHNDQKDDIYTNPNLTSSDDSLLDSIAGHYASFKYTLKHFYIDLAIEKGATPILCTPIVRASSDSSKYDAKSGHVISASDNGKYPGGDYPKAIRDLGAECSVTVVDLTALTKEEYKTIGYNEAIKYHSYNSAKYGTDGTTVIPDGVDNTHTNRYGAKMNAYRIATELLKTQNPLKAHIRTTLTKPEYDVEYPAGINTGYQIKDYEPFDPAKKSTRWTTITKDGWYGSAFGNISVSKAVIEQSGETFKVGTTGDGKITSGGDGIACVFKQLTSDRNFKIEATVTINNYKSDAQSGFGIMLRDDMYIDKKDTALKSNYVAAGYYGVTTSANVNFYREAGSLKPVLTGQTISVATGSTHILSLERTGTTVKVCIDGKEHTTDADFALTSVDSNYMYLCLFATRETQVTFSNIVFTDKGTSVA